MAERMVGSGNRVPGFRAKLSLKTTVRRQGTHYIRPVVNLPKSARVCHQRDQDVSRELNKWSEERMQGAIEEYRANRHPCLRRVSLIIYIDITHAYMTISSSLCSLIFFKYNTVGL